MVVGAGYAYEVRVLRNLNKNIGLIVEPESLELAKSIGNIESETIFQGLIQDVSQDWNAKFDLAIWNYFVAPECELTLTAISRLLKPMGCFYATSHTLMLSYIHCNETVLKIYDETCVGKAPNFETLDSGTLKFKKKTQKKSDG